MADTAPEGVVVLGPTGEPLPPTQCVSVEDVTRIVEAYTDNLYNSLMAGIDNLMRTNNVFTGIDPSQVVTTIVNGLMPELKAKIREVRAGVPGISTGGTSPSGITPVGGPD